MFGRRSRLSHDRSFQPTGAAEDTFHGPNSIPAEWGYAYEDVLFWFPVGNFDLGAGSPLRGRQSEVAGFEITSPGAATLRGIEVGDDLDEVRAAYPELSCGEAAEGELSDFPYCAGKVAPERWIWFGGDPVDNINIARSPLL